MKKKIIITILSLIVTTAFSSYSTLTISKINNELSFKLFQRLEKNENVFFSPFSIYMAISMAYLGSKKETKKEFEKVLKLNEDNVKEFRKITKTIQEKNPNLRIANKIWPAISAKIKKDFCNKLKKIFKIDIREVDYSQAQEAANIINRWTSEKTNGKIKKIILPRLLTPLTRLIITNAVYFYSEWKKKFDEKSTYEDFFYPYKKKKQKIKFMVKEEKIPFYSDKNIKIAKIPYKGNKSSMYIIMPKNIENFAIDYQKVQKYIKKMRIAKVKIIFPKFKIKYSKEMSKIFKSLGIKKAFTPGKADLSGIMNEPTLYIKYILHKAFIEVSEKGTEAAGATAVIIAVKSAPIPLPKKVFKVNKPFIFFIVDEATKTIIFLGRLMKVQKT